MKSPSRLLSSFVALVCLVVSTEATLLNFNFSGQVSAILHDDAAHTFSSNFAVGNSVTGSFRIDTTAVGTLLISPYLETYPASFNAYINGQNFSGAAEYRIFNDAPGGGQDGFSIINEHSDFTSPALGNLGPRTFFFQLLGMPKTTLADLSLVTDPAALFPLATPYAPNGLRLDNRTNPADYGALYFTLNNISGVPDTGATIVLLGSACLGLAFFRRRFGTEPEQIAQ